MKYLKDIDEVTLRRNIIDSLPYLEICGDDGIHIETLIPASAGQYMPYEFLALFDIPLGEDKTTESDIYYYVDEIMDDMNDELEELEVIREFPYLTFVIGFHEDWGICLMAYPLS